MISVMHNIFIIVVLLAGNCLAQDDVAPNVFELLKPSMTAVQAQNAINSQTIADYPSYDTIPKTDFHCSEQTFPGYYADVSTQCQVFHRCDANGRKTSFLCSKGTVYNQLTLVCDFWFNVDCHRSEEFSDFTNSKLDQTAEPLFESPPASFVVSNTGAIAVKQEDGRIEPLKPINENVTSGIRILPSGMLSPFRIPNAARMVIEPGQVPHVQQWVSAEKGISPQPQVAGSSKIQLPPRQKKPQVSPGGKISVLVAQTPAVVEKATTKKQTTTEKPEIRTIAPIQEEQPTAAPDDSAQVLETTEATTKAKKRTQKPAAPVTRTEAPKVPEVTTEVAPEVTTEGVTERSTEQQQQEADIPALETTAAPVSQKTAKPKPSVTTPVQQASKKPSPTAASGRALDENAEANINKIKQEDKNKFWHKEPITVRPTHARPPPVTATDF